MNTKLSEGSLHSGDLQKFSTYIRIAEQTGYVPKDFKIQEIQDDIRQNSDDVVRLRFTRQGEPSQLFHEHFSITIRKSDGLILGFVDLRKENTISPDEIRLLPTEREMPALVKDFFAGWAPQYLNHLDDYAYRSPYGENIMIDGVMQAVAGTEWKWYAPDESDWGWVVFGKNKQPIIFERNIRWVTGRTTEKWLHDRYLETGSLTFVPVSVK